MAENRIMNGYSKPHRRPRVKEKILIFIALCGKTDTKQHSKDYFSINICLCLSCYSIEIIKYLFNGSLLTIINVNI